MTIIKSVPAVNINGQVGEVSSFLSELNAIIDAVNNNAVSSAQLGSLAVTSFNTRTGAVSLTSGDVTGALGYSPANPANAYTWSAPQTFNGGMVLQNGAIASGTSNSGLQISNAGWGSSTANSNDIYGDTQQLLGIYAATGISGYTFTGSDPRIFSLALTSDGHLLLRYPQGNVAINDYGQNAGAVFNNVKAISSSTLTGTTAGSIVSTQPQQGVYKMFAAQAIGYENNSTTAQTITFPTPFANTPVITTNTTGLSLSVSTTALTINAPNNTTQYSGFIKIEGI